MKIFKIAYQDLLVNLIYRFLKVDRLCDLFNVVREASHIV